MRSTLFVFKFHRYNHVVFKTYRNTTLFNLSEIDTAIEPCGQLENKRNTHQIERNSNSKCISVDLSDVPTYMKQFFRFLIWHTRTCNWCKRTKLVDWTQSWNFLLDDSMTCCQNLSILVFFRSAFHKWDRLCLYSNPHSRRGSFSIQRYRRDGSPAKKTGEHTPNSKKLNSTWETDVGKHFFLALFNSIKNVFQLIYLMWHNNWRMRTCNLVLKVNSHMGRSIESFKGCRVSAMKLEKSWSNQSLWLW